MNLLQERIPPIADANAMHAPTRVRWTEQPHIKVRLYESGFLLERCEQEPCLVDHAGLASCGRLACPRCGRGSGNLSVWQRAGLAAGVPVACECGYRWIPRPAEHQVLHVAANGRTATLTGVGR